EEDASYVQIVYIDEKIRLTATRNTREVIQNDLEHGRILKRYVERLKPTHVLLMYFDHVQVSLASRLRFSFPVQLSGIYFRPSFQYERSEGEPSGTLLRNRLKKALFDLALRNRHFDTLFCLDPNVVTFLAAFRQKARVCFLPDGVD